MSDRNCGNCRNWLEFEAVPGFGCCNWQPTEPTPTSYTYCSCTQMKAYDGISCPTWAECDESEDAE